MTKKALLVALFSITPLTNLGCPGPQGPGGSNGVSSLIRFISNDPNCTAGGTMILQGEDLNGNGYLDSTEVQASADVCNGSNGLNGQSPAFTPTIAITPCGASSAQYKEALLGLFGGGIFSEFTGGATSNILLPDGSYYDTDTSACNFTVSTDSSGNRTVSWNGSASNGSGPYNAGSAYYNATTNMWTATY